MEFGRLTARAKTLGRGVRWQVGTRLQAVVFGLSGVLSWGGVKESCYADADCPSPRVCDRGALSPTRGACVYACTSSAECGDPAFECRDHRCLPVSARPITCPSDMGSVGGLFCIDRYEASRPDATAAEAGQDGSRAVSRANVLPWQILDNASAAAACAAAGKRLCTPLEWEAACRGPAGTLYGYGDDYDLAVCNGIDTFGPGEFHLVPTGSMPACVNGDGVFDMNGNLWEHVAGGSDASVRGGAFNCSDSRTYQRCDYVPQTWEPTARGFRCCSAGTAADGSTEDSH